MNAIKSLLMGYTMKNSPYRSFAVLFLGVLATQAGAQLITLTPVNAGTVTSAIVPVNNGYGDQTDPHVSGNLASYVDFSSGSGRIRYFNFLTGTDAVVPQSNLGDSDTLSDIDGTRIVFSRQLADRNAIFLYDTSTSSSFEIDPQPGSARFATAIGGRSVAFVDQNSGNGDIWVHDLVTHTTRNLSSDAEISGNPSVAPDGNTVVWEGCDLLYTQCGVGAARWQPGIDAWTVGPVAGVGAFDLNPATDGTWIVYDSERPSSTGRDIYFQPVGGGDERRLAIAGEEHNPSIHRGVIAFEGRDTSSTPTDIYVYVIASNSLYRVTATSLVDEVLNGVTVLDNGDIRLVWAANADSDGRDSIFATTFTPAANPSFQICLLYDPLVAKKVGAAYPIKLRICDAGGNNLSAPNIAIHAVSVTRQSNSAPGPLDDTGNANPDLDFRYDAALQGYAFNLSLKCASGMCFSTGTYALNFTVGSDPVVHSAPFAVK